MNGDGLDNAGTLIVYRGLFARNQGSGVTAWNPHAADAPGCPTTSLANVTISGNSDGGVEAQCGEVTLTHVTIAANTATDAAGGLRVASSLHSDVWLRNSIVATNSGPQCSATVNVSYSLLGDGSCSFPGGSNLAGVAPKLSALSYHGCDDLFCKLFHLLGASQVQALLPGSPAIDSAGDQFCTATDQLGVQHPLDGDGDGVARCDMGAYEYQPPGPAGSDTR